MISGPYLKYTWKTKIALFFHKLFHRIDQWFIDKCDRYPCESCCRWDEYGCLWVGWVDSKCSYKPISEFNNKKAIKNE